MKKKWIMLLIPLVSLLLSASYVFADEIKDVTADELKKMIDGKEKIALMDVRSDWEYKRGHVPTAKNLAPDKISVIQQYLPDDKDILLIFYCTGGKGG